MWFLLSLNYLFSCSMYTLFQKQNHSVNMSANINNNAPELQPYEYDVTKR